MRIKNIIISILVFALFLNVVSAYLNVSLADHGSNIRNKSSGALLTSGNLSIEVYDSFNGGNLIYNETFASSISNGSWNIMLGENSSNPLSLEFGKIYYKDYRINGENVNFTNLTGQNVDRQFFYSPLGDIGGEDINQSTNITASWFIGKINASDVQNAPWLLISNWNATNTSYALLSQLNNGTYLNTDSFVANYSAFLNKVNWADVNNGTILDVNKVSWINANNGTITDPNKVFWLNVNNGTISDVNKVSWLNVGNGTLTTTNSIWATLSNGTMVAYSTLNNGSYFNVAETDPLAYNGTLASWRGLSNGTVALNNGTFVSWLGVSNGTIALSSQLNNGTYIVQSMLNNGTYVIASILNNGSYFNTGGSDTFAGNYSNFSSLYALATNNTFAQLATLNNGTYVTWLALGNGTYVSASILNNGSYFNTASGEPNWNANYTNLLTNCAADTYAYGIFENGTFKCRADQTGAGGAISGSGTSGYIARFNATSGINNSMIFENGTSI